ncbi:MAG: GNAT family N-acetyltransferase [Verrucomicrobiaceae bacterium]|nr:GNAT family N-acetyltransferase [Verrucomicrobiaceae bacterium]
MWNLLTKRCYLRDYDDDDREAFVRINTDPLARKHLNGPLTTREAHEMFEETLAETDPCQGVRLAVFDRKSNEYLGHVFLVPWDDCKDDMEWGILIRPEHWGRGVGAEAGRAALDESVRRFGLKRVLATIDSEDMASARLLRRLGFTPVGRGQDDQGVYDVLALDAQTTSPQEEPPLPARAS